jgi:hypothetical protein
VNARFCQIYAEAKRRFPPSFRHAPPVSSYDPHSLQHVCMWLISAASQSYPWCAAGESCRFRRCRRHLPAPSGRKHTGQTKITTLVVESMDFLRPCGQSVDLVLDNSIVLPSVPMAEDDGRREPLSWRKSSVLPLSEADRPPRPRS